MVWGVQPSLVIPRTLKSSLFLLQTPIDYDRSNLLEFFPEINLDSRARCGVMSYYITFYYIRSTEYIFGVKALTSCHSQEFRMEEIRYRHTHTLGLGMCISHLVIMQKQNYLPWWICSSRRQKTLRKQLPVACIISAITLRQPEAPHTNKVTVYWIIYMSFLFYNSRIDALSLRKKINNLKAL